MEPREALIKNVSPAPAGYPTKNGQSLKKLSEKSGRTKRNKIPLSLVLISIWHSSTQTGSTVFPTSRIVKSKIKLLPLSQSRSNVITLAASLSSLLYLSVLVKSGKEFQESSL